MATVHCMIMVLNKETINVRHFNVSGIVSMCQSVVNLVLSTKSILPGSVVLDVRMFVMRHIGVIMKPTGIGYGQDLVIMH